jgi:sec-independent protein translocase protein TatC
MDHVHELKGRLFWVAIFFVVAAAASYPFFQTIVDLLIKPLGDHRLYYLSPAGGFSFIIKICMYAGFVGALPVVIYHLYRFIAPVMKKEHAKAVIGYTIASTFLAISGMVFAYLVSLPAALHFLTDINVKQVTAMLTIDAYMSFIIAYLIAGALLFQLPLIMLIINSVTPLKPGKLMGFQRHILIGSFVVAALISPTPDAVNQTLLAAPMVVMYQIGILLVWAVNRRKSRRNSPAATVRKQVMATQPLLITQPVALASVVESPTAGSVLLQEVTTPLATSVPREAPARRPVAMRRYADQPVAERRIRRSIDGMAPAAPLSSHRHLVGRPQNHAPHTVVPASVTPRTTIDGFLAPAS